MRRWAPIAEHRNCARHIYANWKKHFSVKEWQKLFWRCAKAPCLLLFNKARARLARETTDGAQAIMNTHPEHWSRAWFRLGSMCDSVDNNLCEAFNKWIVEARLFPIITMLEIIRRKVMVRIHEQKKKAERWMTKICPAILKKCNTYITLSGRCHAICNGESKFEVIYYDNRFTVDLDRKQCSCRYWQLSGLPCHHAISCIFFKTSSLEDYIASCYSTEAFNRTYDYCLNPLEGMNGWPASDRPPLKAPGYVRMPGRPKKERRRDSTEGPKGTKMSKMGTVIRCSKCKQTGHNRSTCKKRSAAPSQSRTDQVLAQGSASHSEAGAEAAASHSVGAAQAPATQLGIPGGVSPQAIVPMPSTQGSYTSTSTTRIPPKAGTKKRKAPSDPSTSAKVNPSLFN